MLFRSESLWESGLFRTINRRCNTLIDDYEQEFVEASDVMEVSAAIEEISMHDMRPALKLFLTDLQELCIKASRISRPILFVL